LRALALPQTFHLPAESDPTLLPTVLPLTINTPTIVSQTWENSPSHTIYTDGSWNPVTHTLRSSYVFSAQEDTIPWNHSDITAYVIEANNQINASAYDAEMIALTTAAHLTSSPTNIVTDCHGLCTELNTQKATFFNTYLIDAQPECHKVSLPRDGSTVGILRQAISPDLPRINLTYQKSHPERTRTPNHLWTRHQTGNYLADRAAAGDWDSIRPLVHSIQYVTQPLEETIQCHGGLPPPFTILHWNSDQTQLFPFSSARQTLRSGRYNEVDKYLWTKELDYLHWELAAAATRKAFPPPSSYQLFATKIRFDKLHNATMTARFEKTAYPQCPFPNCPNTLDSLDHLFCSCRGCPNPQGPDFITTRQTTLASLQEAATSFKSTRPFTALALSILTEALTTPYHQLVHPYNCTYDSPSALAWTGLFPTEFFTHYTDALNIPTAAWAQALATFVSITLPYCRMLWHSYCTYLHPKETVTTTASDAPISQNYSPQLDDATEWAPTQYSIKDPASWDSFSQSSSQSLRSLPKYNTISLNSDGLTLQPTIGVHTHPKHISASRTAPAKAKPLTQTSITTFIKPSTPNQPSTPTGSPPTLLPPLPFPHPFLTPNPSTLLCPPPLHSNPPSP
jgi:hypothetical protein